MTAFDPLLVVERAYDLEASPDVWIRQLFEAMHPGLPSDVAFGIFRWSKGEAGFEVTDTFHPVVMPVELAELPGKAVPLMPAPILNLFADPVPSLISLSELPDLHEFLSSVSAGSSTFIESVGLLASDGHSQGISIGGFTDHRRPFSERERHRWFRILAHVAGALRLRSQLKVPSERAVAVLDPEGRVLHREESVDGAGASVLTDAVRRLERARGALRRRAPEESLELWRALVEGQLTVIDWVDTDGRRYLVAHENPWSKSTLLGLTQRERDVAEFLRHGRSNSEIAYALGLSSGTVNRLARDVLRKLGSARRQDLAGFFERATTAREMAPGAWAISADAGSSELWLELSSAEKDVVERALRGESNEAIAGARGTAQRTIANQLSRVYARFGVRGRVELAHLLGRPG